MVYTSVEWFIFISLAFLIVLISTISYLMYIRIRQLSNELKLTNQKLNHTDHELSRVCGDIEDFKKLII